MKEPHEITDKIADPKYRDFALMLHRKWRALSRTFAHDVFERPAFYPVVPVKNVFVVPGGYFQVPNSPHSLLSSMLVRRSWCRSTSTGTRTGS